MKASGLMIDLDGTIYKGGNIIPGAVEFVVSLKKRKIPFVFLTNNSASDREHYFKKLRGMGLDIERNNILSSTVSAVRYIKREFPGKKVFPLGTELFVREIVSNGIAVTDECPDIVLLAFDKTITYEKLNKAYHFLLAGAEFIATHPDDLCPTEDAYDIDIGPFIRLLETMTGRTATITGKPNRLMVDIAAEAMGADPEGLWMIGDRLYTDIRMASDAGISSVLVLSGETSAEDLGGSGYRPTAVRGSVSEMVGEFERRI